MRLAGYLLLSTTIVIDFWPNGSPARHFQMHASHLQTGF